MKKKYKITDLQGLNFGESHEPLTRLELVELVNIWLDDGGSNPCCTLDSLTEELNAMGLKIYKA